MIRRPPTAIELTMDDIIEFEQQRRKVRQEKLEKCISKSCSVFFETGGPKTKTEIHNRIGYNPSNPTTSQ
ncbi:unnamed protein product [Ceutorhynchus assimilis]|uniref:Anaphase-promoting complex subunit CDC26 n=1 Tax=Ceutorhynchus assimilis TaxID=467358 RepID=A0A9N9MR84_9CUCU|nr:unnamed protein product [Ceutorhynchus assimilis]